MRDCRPAGTGRGVCLLLLSCRSAPASPGSPAPDVEPRLEPRSEHEQTHGVLTEHSRSTHGVLTEYLAPVFTGFVPCSRFSTSTSLQRNNPVTLAVGLFRTLTESQANQALACKDQLTFLPNTHAGKEGIKYKPTTRVDVGQINLRSGACWSSDRARPAGRSSVPDPAPSCASPVAGAGVAAPATRCSAAASWRPGRGRPGSWRMPLRLAYSLATGRSGAGMGEGSQPGVDRASCAVLGARR